MPNTSYGTPYAASSDTLTGWPTVSQNVANAIDAIGYQNGRGNNAQTGTAYTMVLADAGKTITRSNAAASTHTIPTNASVAFPVGTRVTVTNLGAGAVTINGSGVTILGDYKVLSQYETATIVKTATDTWVVEESVGLAAKLAGEVASAAPSPATAGKVWVDSGTKQGFFGTGSAWVPFTGKILQIVSATTTTQVSINSSTLTDTGLSATITPSSATSKILLITSQPYRMVRQGTPANAGTVLLRGSTIIARHMGFGNTGYGLGVSAGTTGAGYNEEAGVDSYAFIDSPATTSAVTYKTQAKVRDGQTSNAELILQDNTYSLASMILLEVAA